MKLKLAATFVIGVLLGCCATVAIHSYLEAFLRSHTKRDIADCRALSGALEKYRASQGQYPPLEDGVEKLEAYLVPSYIESMPKRDSFNRPYLVFMRGPNAAVVAAGRYGVVVEAGRITRAEEWGRLQ